MRRDAVAAGFADVVVQRHVPVMREVLRIVRRQAVTADVLLEVGAQHVEQRDEHRQLQQQRQTGGQRVDLVLAVELHDLLLLALLVVLVLLFQGADLRR